MKDEEFVNTMKANEKGAWFVSLRSLSFQSVCGNLLRNNRDEKFKTIVSALFSNFGKLGCLINLKINMPYFLIWTKL